MLKLRFIMLKKWKSQEIFIELKAEEEISKHNPEKNLKQQKKESHWL